MNESLMDALKKAGYPQEQMFNHCSDLYIYLTPLTKRVVDKWFKENKLNKSLFVDTFRDRSTGKPMYTPTWEEMCRLKDMFFRDDEVVVQYHPAKSEYVNNMPNCLHLWRPIEQPMPTPPAIMVGIKAGQTDEEIRKAIKEVCE